MSKHYFYTSARDALLEHALLERVEEEGGDKSRTIKHLLLLALGMSDAQEPTKKLRGDNHTELEQRSLALPPDWWDMIELMAFEDGMKNAAWLREQFRVILGKPEPPPKPPRAKRDPALSQSIIIDAQAEMYNDMRNLRSRGKAPEEVTIWDLAEQNPVGVTQVCECFVPGCKLHLVGLHKHNNGQLGTWVRWHRGEVKLDRKTGRWEDLTPLPPGE